MNKWRITITSYIPRGEKSRRITNCRFYFFVFLCCSKFVMDSTVKVASALLQSSAVMALQNVQMGAMSKSVQVNLTLLLFTAR